MEPRLVFRTHYQIDEPIYLGLLVSACTSPTRGDYSQRVAQSFVRALGQGGRKINMAAANYAVDLARGLGVINEQAVWTDLGMLVYLFARERESCLGEDLDLDVTERLLYGRVFLEGDGAAMLFLASHLGAHESVPDKDGDWNSLAREMFIGIYGEYLKISATTADRVALRNQLDRIRRNEYRGKSGAHKCFVHLQTMARIGIIRRTDRGGSRCYISSPEVARFGAVVESVVDLEEIIRSRRLFEALSFVAGDVGRDTPSRATIYSLVALYYRQIVATGVPLCSLRVLVNALQIHGLRLGQLWPAEDIDVAIRAARQETPKSVRLHVNRMGKPAFIRLTDELLSAWEGDVAVTGA